ncbi:sugar ABC transporter substrate-binding protein [Priestia koreensis]|uniref:ABC transporter substrate-binding protein n=1 Tax=Priestia koreensis TaxID=284581 RepID=A0A0M0LIV6_9BACI|nr:ABC transporter substrate-binding protein [Priestia koreensis]KOO50857.1 ABC transporter substrate-binding protein [Priestia koreensis]
MLRKKVGIWFCLLVLVFSLAACSSDKKASGDNKVNEKATLTVWIHPYVGKDLKDQQTKVFDNIAKDFKKKHPKVTVKFQEIPWANREQKILTALSANQGPDVFYLIPDMMAQFADKKLLTPLDQYLGKDWGKDDFSQTALEAVTYDKKIYGLPMLRESMANFYNTKILKEIGGDPNNLPKTWDEFDELGQKAVDKGYFARNFEGSNTPNATLYPFIWQAGGDILDKDGKVIINNEAGVKAFTKINDWYKKGFIPKDSISAADHFTPFVEGKLLAVFGSGATLSALRAKGMNDFVVGPPLKDKEEATFGTTGMFVIPANSENKKLAAEFIETMTSKENSMEFNKLTKYIPARESASSIFDEDPAMKQLASYTDITKPGVMSPVARTIIPKVQAEMQAMLEGNKTPKEAADAAAKAIESELKK